MTDSPMDFYSEEDQERARFLYRNVIKSLEKPGVSREQVLMDLADQVLAMTPRGDWLKMKWTMPPILVPHLTDRERIQFKGMLAKRRHRRNDKFVEVFPHCSDEFSLNTEFLDAAFGSRRLPLLSKNTPVSTLGSCFARNIAVFLKAKGYDARPFHLAEDLNSPFSNAKMLAIATADDAMRRAYLTHWFHLLYPADLADRFDEFIANELQQLDSLAEFIRSSEIMIVTCGNIVDYFLPGPVIPGEPGLSVAPKFFISSSVVDIARRSYLTEKMKAAGADFRLGTWPETLNALTSQHASIRRLNPTAQIIYTLSPVPVDNVIGIANERHQGAVEIDCISKSSLRCALAEFLAQNSADRNLHYFPSFEIVRWIAPNIGMPVFGQEDAASRHVSQDILNGVCQYFLHKYGVLENSVPGQV